PSRRPSARRCCACSASSPMEKASAVARPIRAVRLGAMQAHAEHRPDGTVLRRAAAKLGGYPAKITEKLDLWAARAPERVLFAQRDMQGGWRRVTYAQACERARRLAAGLIARKLSAERPVVVLSGNDIEHALIELGALYAGIPYAPVSPAYSLLSGD